MQEQQLTNYFPLVVFSGCVMMIPIILISTQNVCNTCYWFLLCLRIFGRKGFNLKLAISTKTLEYSVLPDYMTFAKVEVILTTIL